MMRPRGIIVLLLCLLSMTVTAESSVDWQALAKSRGWLNLLLYRKSVLGEDVSRVRNRDFFLSEMKKMGVDEKSSGPVLVEVNSDGAIDPYQELLATVAAFKERASARCAYPARYEFLLAAGVTFPPSTMAATCPELDRWMEWMNAQRVLLIYSSQFMSNPASIFGHTFLRFDNGKLDEYLQAAVDFSAQVPKDIAAIKYAYKGLLGQFVSLFSYIPFVQKRFEYSNMEARDLYEYELKLSAHERKIMALHLYELINRARFTYFFFSENCSYMLLTLLEAVRPELDLTGNDQGINRVWGGEKFLFYAAPLETLMRLEQAGILGKMRYRPSIRSRLSAKYRLLSSDEKAIYRQIAWDFTDAKQAEALVVEKVQTPLLAEALLDYIETEYIASGGMLAKKEQEVQKILLVRRASMGRHDNYDEMIPAPSEPHLGHKPRSLGLALGQVRGQNRNDHFVEFDFRPAIHVVDDQDIGYLKFSEINFVNVKTRFYKEKNQISLERLTMGRMVNLLPQENLLEHRLSWQVAAELLRNELSDASSSPNQYQQKHKLRLQGRAGYGTSIGSLANYLGALLETRVEQGNIRSQRSVATRHHFRALVGPSFDYFKTWGNDFKLHFYGAHLWQLVDGILKDPTGSRAQEGGRPELTEIKGTLSYYLSSHWASSLSVSYLKHNFEAGESEENEVILTGHYYF